MAVDVYANGRSILGKSAGGKSISAFPDVCFTPAPPPPGVPVPYPNTGFASDLAKGSSTVKVHGKPAALKNVSYIKTSTGDEAGCASKKGAATGKIKGKIYFTSWSPDVQIEGYNVVRHLDTGTHNHGSDPGNTFPWPFTDKANGGTGGACADNIKKEKKRCAEFKPYGEKDPCPPLPVGEDGETLDKKSTAFADAYEKAVREAPDGANKCLAARRCSLQPKEGGDCCPGQTGHHLVEGSAFFVQGNGKKPQDAATGVSVPIKGTDSYKYAKAPCICVEGAGHGQGTHKLMHLYQSDNAMRSGTEGSYTDVYGVARTEKKMTTLRKAETSAAKSVREVFPESGCKTACIKEQLKEYHESQCGMSPDQPIKAVHTCNPNAKTMQGAKGQITARRGSFKQKDGLSDF